MKKLFLLLFLFQFEAISYEWIMTHKVYNEIILSIHCPTPDNCYVLAQDDLYSRVYKSTDMGASWIMKYQSDPGNEGEPILINAEDGSSPLPNYYYYSLWESGYLKVSNDDCKTFSRINLEIDESIDEVEMFDTSLGIALSGDYYFITKNGWIDFEKKLCPFNGYFESPVFKNKDTIVTIIHSYDSTGVIVLDINSNEYSFFKTKTGHSLDNVFVIDSEIIYVAGRKRTGIADRSLDVIYKTTDGGFNWELILENEFEPAFGLQEISFRDENVGMAVGQFGKVVITVDGGNTWNYLELSDDLKEWYPPTMKVAWAGDYPIVGTFTGRLFRLEDYDYTDIKEILRTPEISIRQSYTELLVSISDEKFRKYKLQIFDIMGNVAAEQELSSGVGILYVPYDISDLTNGAYLYIISCEGVLIKTGKLVSINN